MKQIVFDNFVVRQHPLYKYPICQSTLNQISQKDYAGTNYFDSGIEAIDVDYYEQHVRNNIQSDKTVDAAIGISDFDGKRSSYERLLMIELKIEVHSFTKKFFKECSKKVSYSKNILVWDRPLDGKVFLVFDVKISNRHEDSLTPSRWNRRN